MLYYILVKYSGTFPKSFFSVHAFSSTTYFGADNIFSTALVTIKFLFDFNPWIGASFFLGTGGLTAAGYLYCLTKHIMN